VFLEQINPADIAAQRIQQLVASVSLNSDAPASAALVRKPLRSRAGFCASRVSLCQYLRGSG
jgi:hypothetical protein